MKKLCGCGCGEPVRSNVQVYLEGHKPSAAQAPAAAGPGESTGSGGGEAEAYDLTLTLTLAQIESVWGSLTPLQKATGLVSALQSGLEQV